MMKRGAFGLRVYTFVDDEDYYVTREYTVVAMTLSRAVESLLRYEFDDDSRKFHSASVKRTEMGLRLTYEYSFPEASRVFDGWYRIYIEPFEVEKVY